MADKWADFVITAVRFNSAGTHIEEVRTWEHTGTELTNQTTRSRHTVVTQIEDGYTYCTATESKLQLRSGSQSCDDRRREVHQNKSRRNQEGQPRQTPNLLGVGPIKRTCLDLTRASDEVTASCKPPSLQARQRVPVRR
jgi:hypothetical protein